MSDFSTDETLVSEPDPGVYAQAATAQSLEERMALAEKEETLATSEKFPIPGWANFAYVELKVLGPDAQQEAVDKCIRVKPAKLQNLYIAAETLLAATAGFWEVQGDDPEEFPPYDTSWNQIAAVVYKMKERSPRQAILRVIGAENILTFYGQYLQWLQTSRERINAKQAQDFQTTP